VKNTDVQNVMRFGRLYQNKILMRVTVLMMKNIFFAIRIDPLKTQVNMLFLILMMLTMIHQ